jgi:hypothetical protein
MAGYIALGGSLNASPRAYTENRGRDADLHMRYLEAMREEWARLLDPATRHASEGRDLQAWLDGSWMRSTPTVSWGYWTHSEQTTRRTGTRPWMIARPGTCCRLSIPRTSRPPELVHDAVCDGSR